MTVKKKGPSRKAKKSGKKAAGSLSSSFIKRGHTARMRRSVLPI